MSTVWPLALKRYGVAVLWVLIALGARLLSGPVLGNSYPFLFFTPAVFVSAVYAGFGPGLLATIFSALIAKYIFVPPSYSLSLQDPADLLGLLVYLTTGVLMSWLGARLLSRNEQIDDVRPEVGAQKRLSETTELMDDVFENMSDGFFALDRSWRCTFVNRRGAEIARRSKEELIGRRVMEVFPDAAEQMDYAYYQRAMREQEPASFENYYEPYGLWYETRIQPSQTGLSVLVRDITARKGRETEFAHLAAIVTSSDDAIVSKTLEGIITSWNAAAERLFGYQAAEAIGQPITIIIPEDRLEEEAYILERIRNGEAVEHLETVRRRKDGELVDISLTISPVKVDGRIIGASKIARDIRGRKQANEMLQEQADLLDISHDAIFVWEIGGGIQYWNAAAQQLYGYSRSEALGQVSHRLLKTVHASGSQFFEDQIVADRHWQGELVHTTRDNRQIAVESRQVVVERRGKILVMETNRDITERKRAEAEREHFLIAEREARAHAEEASRLKDEFLATMSHELRTPLNAILGWAQLLEDGKLEERKAHNAIKIIERNAKTQSQLIEDLLDVSRIVTGKLRLNVRPVMPAAVIESALDAVRPMADAKKIRLHSMLDPDAGPIAGDAERLQQVVWNLLNNAIKFTPKGGQVQIRLERINSSIEIIVSDTGQGVKSEFLPNVFDRFRQADASPARGAGGLGLGLAIVRHLVELHGGSVRADSPGEGLGSTFTVRLPLMVVHQRVDDEGRVNPRVESMDFEVFDATPDLAGVRVLVVDDEPDTRMLLREILEQCGAEVRDAGSAAQGLREVREWRPTVIASDIGMPVRDGYEFMRDVRQWEEQEGVWIPAIALTAYARSEDRMRALAAGYQIHVAKPVNPIEFALMVASLVGRTFRGLR